MQSGIDVGPAAMDLDAKAARRIDRLRAHLSSRSRGSSAFSSLLDAASSTEGHQISLNPDVRTPWSSSSPSRSPLATAHAASSIRSAENTWSLDAALRTARAVLASWGPRNPRLVVNPVVPMTLAHVYQVHDEIERLVEPSRLAGWKLGAPGASVDEDTGKPCVAVVAPLLRETIADENLAFSIEGSKLFGVEVEIAFVMKSDLVPLVKDGSCETKTTEAVENPQSGAFDVDEVWEAVGETRLALELIGSRLPSLENAPGLLKLADLICAGGVVLGQRVEVADPRDLANVAATLSFDGVVVDTGKAEVCPAGSPIDALVWLANHLAKRGKYLRAGDVIISGKICVATGINSYQRVSAEFSGLGSVSTFLLP